MDDLIAKLEMLLVVTGEFNWEWAEITAGKTDVGSARAKLSAFELREIVAALKARAATDTPEMERKK